MIFTNAYGLLKHYINTSRLNYLIIFIILPLINKDCRLKCTSKLASTISLRSYLLISRVSRILVAIYNNKYSQIGTTTRGLLSCRTNSVQIMSLLFAAKRLLGNRARCMPSIGIDNTEMRRDAKCGPTHLSANLTSKLLTSNITIALNQIQRIIKQTTVLRHASSQATNAFMITKKTTMICLIMSVLIPLISWI